MEQLKGIAPVVEAMEGIVNVIAGHNRPELREVALNLKRSGGEAWAIGEMVERTCLMLDALGVMYAGQEASGPSVERMPLEDEEPKPPEGVEIDGEGNIGPAAIRESFPDDPTEHRPQPSTKGR